MKGAPFIEAPVAADTTDADAIAARKQLDQTLETLVGKERAHGDTTPPAAKREKRRLRKQAPVPPTTPPQ